MNNETIYALSTIRGKSGIAVIRISGTKSYAVLTALTNKEHIKPRKATCCIIKSPYTGEVLDKAMVIFFTSPNSFTGEDVVEFHLHGSIAVINDVIDVLGKMDGLRMAEPGEFTRIAFENGKMDLIAVEALGDLIHAETSIQRRNAINQMSGQLQNLYNTWKDIMIGVMAQIEAYIDFPDDDIPDVALEQAKASIKQLICDMQQHLMISNKATIVSNGLHIAIIGAPNVGKSTLMNLLTQQEIAIVSDIAGTTRDIIQVNMQINGIGVTLYDTAGIRDITMTDDIIEQEGIRRAKNRLKSANIRIYVVDVNDIMNKMRGEDIDMAVYHFTMQYLISNDVTLLENSVVLLNKYDICSKIISYDMISGSLSTIVPFSANTGYNVQILMQKLEEIIVDKYSIANDMVVTTQHRQKQKLLECISHLENFSTDKPMEIAAQDVRLAAIAIQSITGEITLDEVLDKIFSTFCIGK